MHSIAYKKNFVPARLSRDVGYRNSQQTILFFEYLPR
jgi:hypothetical protein